MSDTSWNCYLKGIGTEGIPSNGDIGMMKTRLDKLQSVADAYKELTEKEAALCRRMDRLQKRMDEVGDVEGDPAAPKPLAARSY
jgi:hypothetical protein